MADPMAYNNNFHYTEWHNALTDKELHMYIKRKQMAEELEKERQRLSNALSAIPQLLTDSKTPSLQDFANRTELSVAEILLDNWDSIIELVATNERLKGEVSRLLQQVEQLSTSIQNAVESALRPVRDIRVNDDLLKREF
jgi:cell division protein ZapA (FtsZ GTPase activity inhibitor)